MGIISETNCPKCLSSNTTRFEWYENHFFQNWTCWDCDSMFVIDLEKIKRVRRLFAILFTRDIVTKYGEYKGS